MGSVSHTVPCHAVQSQAESEWEAQRSRLQQSVAEGERKARQLTEQRDALQRQLEKAAAEAPGEGAWLAGWLAGYAGHLGSAVAITDCMPSRECRRARRSVQ